LRIELDYPTAHCDEYCLFGAERTRSQEICVGGIENLKHQNELDLFDSIDPNESKHKRTDRTVLCCLKKAKAGIAWPRLTKDKAKFQWLGVDFNNWKDWEDDSDEDLSSFDKFSEASKSKHVMLHKMMNTMGGEDGMPDLGMGGIEGLKEHDSDDEKMPDLE
uniref:CS domain-containing protein n=1 Tax=Oncorhynchus tshawytscha TaxID=74940 RepID=A0A8C8JNX0_ONCTS